MKAILVIDMPSCCVECPCYDFDLGLCSPKNEITDVDGRHDERAEWCPLKPLPTKITTATLSDQEQERTELFTSMALLKTYADGWNDCLNEILGEEE